MLHATVYTDGSVMDERSGCAIVMGHRESRMFGCVSFGRGSFSRMSFGRMVIWTRGHLVAGHLVAGHLVALNEKSIMKYLQK
jgi:hypothetical protein